jgi:DNA repair exonuclease SbcCD nuclease subunit
MNYQIKTDNYKKIGIFSDIHVGVGNDSKLKLDETQKCLDWIIKKFKNENVDWVIFCGDLFNSRYSINVNTLNVGIKLIEELSFNFEKIFLIGGNHDTYYKNSNIVNSVNFLQKISKNDNIRVVDEEPIFIKISDISLGLYPWGITPEYLNEIENFKTPTYGFGHFEMNGIEMAGGISSGSKFSLTNIFSLGDTLFSGHYHLNKIYKEIKLNKTLYMVGCPLQLDWGDYGNTKKILVLNTENGKINEFKNTKNAEFKKIFYSSLEKNEYNDDELKKICHKNFIKFIIDKQYKFENILKFTELIKKHDPYTLNLEYLISISNNSINDLSNENIKNNSKTNKEYLLDYLENVFVEYEKVNNTLDLSYLKEICVKYYEKSLIPEKDRLEKEI